MNKITITENEHYIAECGIPLARQHIVTNEQVSLWSGAKASTFPMRRSTRFAAAGNHLRSRSATARTVESAWMVSGSLVRRGQAIASATATGVKAYFGRAAELVRVAHAVSTEQKVIMGVPETSLS